MFHSLIALLSLWFCGSLWLKVNFDGSVFSLVSRGCVGSVVRDYDGNLILIASVHLFDVLVPLVEMSAAWSVVKATVFHIGATKLWIEGDVLEIILTNRKGSGVDGYAPNLLQCIKPWLQILEE